MRAQAPCHRGLRRNDAATRTRANAPFASAKVGFAAVDGEPITRCKMHAFATWGAAADSVGSCERCCSLVWPHARRRFLRTFALGDDPAHGSNLKTWPSDIPTGVYGKKRFMLRGKDNTTADAEWIDIPDGEPRSKVVTIYSQHATSTGYVSVQVDVRAPNP